MADDETGIYITPDGDGLVRVNREKLNAVINAALKLGQVYGQMGLDAPELEVEFIDELDGSGT